MLRTAIAWRGTSSLRAVVERYGCFQQTFTRCLSWGSVHPPCPPATPPSTDELHLYGLPLLRQVAHHAKLGRTLLTQQNPGEKSETVSYHTAMVRAAQVSEFLSHLSNEKSDATRLTAHLTLPGSDYVACQFGAFGAGMGSVPLALSHKTAELEHVLRDSNPELIWLGNNVPNSEHLYEAAAKANMADRIVNLELSDVAPNGNEDEHFYWMGSGGIVQDMESPAVVLYTSGTTGPPKGVVLTHRNLYYQVTDLITAWEWQPSDVALHVLPLHHVHGVVNLLLCAAFSGAQLDFRHPFDAHALWKSWSRPLENKPNVFMAVPTIYAKLLEAAESLPRKVVDDAVANTLAPMRLMVSGSAALPESILRRWKELTGHVLLERYGMTEFAMALSNPYVEDETQSRHPGHVGEPLPSVEVQIDKEGELLVKGPTVFEGGYLNRPDATAEAFTEDGYFRTGDIAEFNEELGSYRILGRASVDILQVGGNKLSALEIERELLEHPDIAEVAIVGVPDETWGQRVGMICRLKQPSSHITLEELQSWCEPRMERIKAPTKLRILEEIPKNAMGKVNKKELVPLFTA